MKLSENFDLRELIAPDIYDKIGDRAADWLNGNTIKVLESLRSDFSFTVAFIRSRCAAH